MLRHLLLRIVIFVARCHEGELQNHWESLGFSFGRPIYETLTYFHEVIPIVVIDFIHKVVIFVVFNAINNSPLLSLSAVWRGERAVGKGLFRFFFAIEIGVVPENNWPAQLLHYHLWYCQAKPNTILVDVVFDVEFIEHFANIIWVLEPDALVSHPYF